MTTFATPQQIHDMYQHDSAALLRWAKETLEDAQSGRPREGALLQVPIFDKSPWGVQNLAGYQHSCFDPEMIGASHIVMMPGTADWLAHRSVLHVSDWRERCLACAMGLQDRLGASSQVHVLDPETLRMVLDNGVPMHNFVEANNVGQAWRIFPRHEFQARPARPQALVLEPAFSQPSTRANGAFRCRQETREPGLFTAACTIIAQRSTHAESRPRTGIGGLVPFVPYQYLLKQEGGQGMVQCCLIVNHAQPHDEAPQ